MNRNTGIFIRIRNTDISIIFSHWYPKLEIVNKKNEKKLAKNLKIKVASPIENNSESDPRIGKLGSKFYLD